MKMPRMTLMPVVVAMLLPSANGLAAKKTTLEVWINGWNPYNVVADAVKGFEKVYPNTTVKVLPLGSQFSYATLITRVASGTSPDLMSVMTPMAQLSDRGFLTPLNAFMKRSKNANEKNYDPSLLKIFSTGGTVYAVPSLEIGPWLGLCYNKVNLKEAGLDPEHASFATMEDLEVAHRKMTRIENGIIRRWGMDPFGSIGDLYFPEVWGSVFGATMVTPNGRRIVFDTPEMVKAVDWAVGFKSVVTPQQFDRFRGTAGDWGVAIARGTKTMEVNGYWTPGQVAAHNKDAQVGYTWVPTPKKDKLMVSGGFGFAIPKGSKHTDLAFKLIEYMATKEPSQRIFDGIGFLNGNRQVLKELDLSTHPGVRWYLDAANTADRNLGVPDAPEWDTCKTFLRIGIDSVARKRDSTQAMLKKVQQQTDIVMDKYFKQIKKYVR